MKKFETHSKHGLFSSLLVFTCFIAASLDGAVVEWQFEKIIGYTQTTNGVAGAESAWAVEIYVKMDDYPNDADQASISGGGIAGSLDMTWDAGEWIFDKQYESKGDLDAEFPSNSTYTITLSKNSLVMLTQTFTLGSA